MTSLHYMKERMTREYCIEYIIGDGHVIESFVLNKGHKDGQEIHLLTNTGIIVIENYYTKKVITKLIARPGQIRRYYANIGKSAPQWLLMLAFQHQKMEYNHLQ